MRLIRLAYRDRDRLPLIACIREMARRHYDVDVDVVRIQPTDEYEAALFDDRCDLIVEHLEYLYARAAAHPETEATMFCAPVDRTGVELMAPPAVKDVSELRGKTIAVRSSGRPDSIYMRLRAAGLDPSDTVLVADADVGRWGQWKKVVSGECAAVFMSPLYMAPAEAAGLEVLPVPDLPMVGNFGHACLTRFAAENDGLMEDYVRAVVHAICLIKYRREEALEIVLRESADLATGRGIDAGTQLDVLGRALSTVPYPPPEAIANTYRVACAQDPSAEGLDPLTLWDPRWVTRLDASGFIAGITGEMSTAPERPR
ncbi:MAG: hypothetical protein IIA54_03800 [Chloroflexi bacterium]|nr:hypothetical protein [Chloroflexota bacterium]